LRPEAYFKARIDEWSEIVELSNAGAEETIMGTEGRALRSKFVRQASKAGDAEESRTFKTTKNGLRREADIRRR